MLSNLHPASILVAVISDDFSFGSLIAIHFKWTFQFSYSDKPKSTKNLKITNLRLVKSLKECNYENITLHINLVRLVDCLMFLINLDFRL